MAEEIELDTRQTAWVRGATNTKMGHALLTSDRLLFFEQKFAVGVAGGALGAALAARLQRRSEDGGPLLEVPLAAITGLVREKKLLNKDRIRLRTAEEDFLFNDGWKAWNALLRQALQDHHGRRVVEDGEDAWRVDAVPPAAG